MFVGNLKRRDKKRRTKSAEAADCGWHVERLESRCLLAGSITGVVRGTTLRLTGDAASNDVVLSTVAGAIQVTSGANSTTIAIDGDLDGVRRIVLDTGGGADVVSLNGLEIESNLTIAGDGELHVGIADSNIGGTFIIRSNSRLDVDVDDSSFLKRTAWKSTDGDSTVDFSGSTLVGPLVIGLERSGTRSLTFSDTTADRGVTYASAEGDVTIRLRGTTQIDRRFSSVVKAGSDDFGMLDTSRINGRLLRRTLGGDSTTILEDSGGVSDVRIVENAEVGRFLGSGVNVARNVVFATRDTGDLKADVYTPKTEGPHPAILVIHGGVWRIGSKSTTSSRSRVLADRGYVVVSIDYRLAPNNQFPDQIYDVKSAITWMRQNAAELSIDPDRIGTYGYSAGGQLALLLATTDGSEGLEGPDADASTSTRVQAVVAGGPAVDFRDFAPNDNRLSYFLGGTISDLPDVYRDASPANWVSGDDPPTMIFMGENDAIVSRPKVDAFLQDLDAAGVPTRFHEVAGKGHLSALGDSKALLASAKFFDEILK